MPDVILKGIDVSEHNGVIDWQRVKDSGQVDFAILRAGYGQNAVDQRFRYNASECNRLGIPIGVYWFSYASSVSSAIKEANKCIETIKDYKIDYPVAFDWEDDSVRVVKNSGVIPDRNLATNLVKTFLDLINEAGYKVCLYTNPSYLNQWFDWESIKKYLNWHVDLWLAQWPYNIPDLSKPPAQNPAIWQYSEKGKIQGILTAVDLNVSYIDYSKKEDDYDMAELNMENLKKALKFENQKQWFEKKDDGGTSYLELSKALGFTDGSKPYEIPSRAEVMTMIARMAVEMQADFDAKLNKAVAEYLSKNSDDRK